MIVAGITDPGVAFEPCEEAGIDDAGYNGWVTVVLKDARLPFGT